MKKQNKQHQNASSNGGKLNTKSLMFFFFFFLFSFFILLRTIFLGDCCLFNEDAYESCRYCECKYDPVEIMSDARHYPTDSCLYRNTGAYQDGFCHDELNTGDLSLLC
jgi:hypothetical protein